MTLAVAVLMDPIGSIKPAKDTTLALLLEAQPRRHRLYYLQQGDLALAGGRTRARMAPLQVRDDPGDWYSLGDARWMDLAALDVLLLRKDPPFDSEYFYATHLLEQAEREGARVINSPRSLRDHPEKLAVMEFPQLVPPTLVSRDAQEIRRFHALHGDIILKPLDGMGGLGIFRVGPDGLNLGSITETLNQQGTRTLMAQRYVPEIVHGDKRVLIIAGEPVPYVLARIPQGNEIRGNLAAGGKGVAQPLSPRDREIAAEVGARLAPRGLLLIGLDVIGDRVTEINVTSPTCFQEIQQQTGFDVAQVFVDALERTVEQGRR